MAGAATRRANAPSTIANAASRSIHRLSKPVRASCASPRVCAGTSSAEVLVAGTDRDTTGVEVTGPAVWTVSAVSCVTVWSVNVNVVVRTGVTVMGGTGVAVGTGVGVTTGGVVGSTVGS